MGALIDIASAILTEATRRVEINAQNVANIPTAGYKRRIAFTDVLAEQQVNTAQDSRVGFISDFSEGKLLETGNPFDFAISGRGFFVVRSDNQTFYTRQGNFRREADGRLVTFDGLELQAQGGGAIVLRSDAFEVAADGMVLEDGQPVAKLALVDVADRSLLRDAEGGLFTAPAADPVQSGAVRVRQGVLEASNVSTGDEMVAMMEALRRAEAGQRLVNVYDDLMGRALSSFGQT